ncbi:Melanoma antigen recognized by T-cells 1 [Heterocephalus glaber]|uniref:Melanoma antigen recognized by T-cells 1 n=1 Tax=Heterocephalus glaber TaxID=10181 RepID=G5B6S2_HETGA|nr:Melanoma antigen recognized by T-cells 1 [Heterocephalus glaber]
MPQEEGHFSHGYPRKGHGHAYITTEEAAGIGILTVILGILLLIGCWYCRRQSGYRTLMDKNLHAGVQGTLCRRCSHEELGHQDTKLFFQEKNCEPLVPNAPPAYEKLSREQSPPPYSP